MLKAAPGKKQAQPETAAIQEDEVNAIRRATKGCLGIMKDKINAQFEKKPEFDMSFGLGRESLRANESLATGNAARQKLQEYKNEMDRSVDEFAKKREKTLSELKNQEPIVNIRKSKTPLRLNK